MYTEVGSFDAIANLPMLLGEVQHGKRFTIVLNGSPVADLVPSESKKKQEVKAAVEAMRHIHKIQGVSDEMLREWIAEGRQ